MLTLATALVTVIEVSTNQGISSAQAGLSLSYIITLGGMLQYTTRLYSDVCSAFLWLFINKGVQTSAVYSFNFTHIFNFIQATIVDNRRQKYILFLRLITKFLSDQLAASLRLMIFCDIRE